MPARPALLLAATGLGAVLALAACGGDKPAPGPAPAPGPGPAETAPIKLGPAPEFDEHTLMRGRLLYQKECQSCHGAKCTGDGPGSAGLKNDAGEAITPRDFTSVGTAAERDERIAQMARLVRGGVPCTPMPAFPNLTDAQVWELARYVNHVAEQTDSGPADPPKKQ